MDDQINPPQPTQSPVQGSINLNEPKEQAPPPQQNDPLSPPPSDTPPPSDGRKIVRIGLIIFSILFFITIAVLGVIAYQRNQTFVQNQPTPTPQEEIVVSPTILPTNTPTASPSGYINNAASGEGMVFTSNTLGIQFQYVPEQNNQLIETFETETKVYIYPDTIEPQNGQFVEVFVKDANKPIEEAIKERFLVGRSEDECFIELIEGTDSADSTITKIQISYPEVENGDFEGMIEKMNYCAPDHARTNGIRYFWYDSNHPTKYLFFDIGQYFILAGDEVPWQDTIEIIN